MLEIDYIASENSLPVNNCPDSSANLFRTTFLSAAKYPESARDSHCFMRNIIIGSIFFLKNRNYIEVFLAVQ